MRTPVSELLHTSIEARADVRVDRTPLVLRMNSNPMGGVGGVASDAP
jgi:hypothetical protein